MLKRIDLNVVRLEKEILGRVEAEYEPTDGKIDKIEYTFDLSLYK